MVRRRGNNISQTLKDYGVPVIGFLLIFVLIYSFFSGGSAPDTLINENRIGLRVALNNVDSQGFIEYSSGEQKEIGADTQWYRGEKLLVKSGNITVKQSDESELRLSKNGILSYDETGTFSLSSANLWIDGLKKININLVFGSVVVGENTHISLSQNEVQSSVYLLSGFAEVRNNAGQTTLLSPGEKITIAVAEANSKNFDADAAKQEIDESFMSSSWFILNNGAAYIGKDREEIVKDGTATGSVQKISQRVIVLNNILDESNVSSDTISISGNYNNVDVTKITLNGVDALMNTVNKSFTFENVDTRNRENDLVFKVYDDANDLLEKFVYVVYYAQASQTATSQNKFNVKNYDIDGTDFIFTVIKDGFSKNLNGKTIYTTTGDFLTLYGKVTASDISKVVVNGYTLSSYKGSTWRYHPSSVNNNLSVGTNVYKIEYLNAQNKVVYTNSFTIVKKDKQTNSSIKEKKVMSGEVTL